MKAYVCRISNFNEIRKEYKRTKCCDCWTTKKDICWKFSLQAAKKIVERYNSWCKNRYITYEIEIIDNDN